MNFKQYIYFFIASLFSCSCFVQSSKIMYSSSYILGYREVETISVDNRDIPQRNSLIFAVYGEGHHLYPFDDYNGTVSNYSIQRFQMLAEKHNDILPKKKAVRFSEPIRFNVGPVAPAIDIKNVMLTSQSLYDEQHIEGDSLNDIVRIIGLSPYKYIQSGYIDKYDYSDKNFSDSFCTIYDLRGEKECHPIDKLVKDISQDDLYILTGTSSDGMIISPMFYLCFEQLPKSRPQQVLLEIITDGDKKFSTVINIE